VDSAVPRVSSQTIVGREGPLRQLDDALAATPRIVLVTGEAGVGKTRLVQELEQRAGESGFLVLHGESIEFGGETFPFAPLAAALRDAGELGALLPSGASGEYGKARLCELVLDQLAGLGPALLVLEDVHWADRSTRDFLAFLARRVRDERLAVVATYRSGELPRSHPLRRLLTELTRHPVVTRLDLSPLDRDAVALQLEAIAGGPVPARLAEELHARSGGNPFFVEELFAARRDDLVPDTVADTVLARVQRLSPRAQRLLTVLAAAGGPVDPAVLEPSVPELGPALREARDAGLLVGDVALRHGLIGEVVYGSLGPGERVELHRGLAEALAASGASPARLADQWHRAGDRDAALAASLAAAGEAEAVYAYPEARVHLERALDLSDDRVELLARAAQAARFDGDRDRALELAREALELLEDDPSREARLCERLGEYESFDDHAALAWYERALGLLPSGPSPERARLLAAQGHALMGLRRWQEARVCCEAALEQGHDTAGLTLGLVLAFLGDIEAGERAVRRALATAEGEDAARAHVHLGELLRLAGRHAAALDAMAAGERVAARLGMRGTFGHFMFVNAADDLLRLGRWDEAEARLLEAERLDLGVTAGAMRGATAGHLYALRGEAAAARRHLEAALELAGERLPGEFVVPIRSAWATLALAGGDPAEARRHVDAAFAAVGDERDPLYTPALHWLGARAAADLGEPDAAAALVADLDGLRTPVPDALAHRATAEAELSRARGTPDPDLWHQAVEAWVELAEPYPAAYARLRAAEALLLAGRRDGVGELLNAANATAVELGAHPLREHVRALAGRARLRLGPKRRAVEQSVLTQREIDVLRLLAHGLTNRQIARRLFISEKTVGTHVAHIFAKLGVHTRVEAASRAQALGVST
jgi:DNA-binding CsgD family transcriptional regulator/tetratricopeptide (TPR) repeat protein